MNKKIEVSTIKCNNEQKNSNAYILECIMEILDLKKFYPSLFVIIYSFQ